MFRLSHDGCTSLSVASILTRPFTICIESELLKNFFKKNRSGKKLIGLAKLSYLQDPMSDRKKKLSATLGYDEILGDSKIFFGYNRDLII